MNSAATTPAAYIESLPPDRRKAMQTVRRFIASRLDPRHLKECMQYGVIAYCVPHRVWPQGHHTRPDLPLMYMGLSSLKNDMVVYMLFLLHDRAERAWFSAAWHATGKRLKMDVGGMGCCLRFKTVDDLALDVIAEAMRRVPVKTYLERHAAMLASRSRKGTARARPSEARAKDTTAKPATASKSKRASTRTRHRGN